MVLNVTLWACLPQLNGFQLLLTRFYYKHVRLLNIY